MRKITKNLLGQLRKNEVFFSFIKFCLGGIVNLGLNTGLTFFLVEVVGLYYLWSFAIVQVIIVFYGFFYNLKITFRVKHWDKSTLTRFVFFLWLFYFINLGLVKFLTETLGFYYIISIILTVAITIGVRFYIYKKLVFKPKSV